MFWNRLCSILMFTLRKRSWALGAILILTIGAITVAGCGLTMADINTFWEKKLNTVFSAATLLVALAVWFGETHQDWMASLPCKLTAIFIFDDQEVMRCNKAELFSEADIRALGQQLGLQMNNNNQLKMKSPAILKTGGVQEKDVNGKLYRHWSIQFTLLERPKTVPEGKVLCWEPPFDKTPEQSFCDS